VSKVSTVVKLPAPPAPPAPPAATVDVSKVSTVVKLPAPPAPPAATVDVSKVSTVVKLPAPPAPPAPPATRGELPTPPSAPYAPTVVEAAVPLAERALTVPGTTTPPKPPASPAAAVTQVANVPAAKPLADALATPGWSKPADLVAPAAVPAATGTDAVNAALTTPPAPPAPPFAAPQPATSASSAIGVTAQHHSVGLPPIWILPAGFGPSSPDGASPVPVTVTRSATDGASVPTAPAPAAPSAPVGVGVSGGFGASGVGGGVFAVLLVALGGLAAQRLFRFVVASAQCRPVAFVWLLERPG
jgi:collagen type IV alpha